MISLLRRRAQRHDLIRSVQVPVDGARVHTRVADVAPAGAPVVVLVHGLGMSGRTLEPLIRRLAPHLRVYTPDLPGFGRSGKPGRALEIEELADALHTWVDVLGIAPDVFVAHSLGCQVIGDLALRHHGSVPAAVWINPTRDPEARTVLANALRLLRDAPREPFALLVLASMDYLRSSPRLMIKTFADAILLPVRRVLPSLAEPVLILRGEHDPVVPRRFVASLVDLLPDGRSQEVAGGAHGVPFSHPEQVAGVVLDFVRPRLGEGSTLHPCGGTPATPP